MDTTSAESLDRLRQVIDDEISSLEEATRALGSRRNALAPISRLPPETLTAIFLFLSPSAWHEQCYSWTCGDIAWMRIAHVCHRWREIALNHPQLWSHINVARLTPAAMAEILARAKLTPLHLEANHISWSMTKLDAFERQLESHITHTRHLSFHGPLQTALQRLVSPAPALEFLSLSHKPLQFPYSKVVTPVNLFNYTAPCLTSLTLDSCDISWKSPLLKGLRTLKIHDPSAEARPNLEDWLNALNEMPQLETLHLECASPLAPQAVPLISEPSRAVTLPSLTGFRITSSAKDCLFALAHISLPALTWLHVDVESLESEGEDVRLLIPYVARSSNELQGTESLRSMQISGTRRSAKVLAWTMSNADLKFYSSVPCLTFVAKGSNWLDGVDTTIVDALLTPLPVDSVSTLIVYTRLNKEFWLSHAPRWPLLKQTRLDSTATKAFMDMLAEDTPPDGPRIPSLTKLILIDVRLTALRTYHLRDILIERVEQGVPLEVLDLHSCVAADRAIPLLREVVVDVQAPWDDEQRMTKEEQDWHGTGYCNEVDYDDRQGSWYDYEEGEGEYEYVYDDYSVISDNVGFNYEDYYSL